MFPHECKKSTMNATELSLRNVGYGLIGISQWWRTRKDKPAYCYSLCCQQFMTAGSMYHCRVAWALDGLAVLGGKNFLTKRVLVRWLTLWLNLASHKKVNHILPLFQNAELTFLRRGCCLEHVYLFDVVTVLKIVL